MPDATAVRTDRSHAAPRRRGLVVAAVGAGAAVVLVAGGLAWALTRDDDPDDTTSDDAPVTLVGGDLDGDGLGDALVSQVRPLSVDAEGLRALRSNGSRFESPVESDAEPGYPKTADVDDDGALDVVWVESDFNDDTRLTVTVVPTHGEPWEPVEVPVDPSLGIDGYSAQVGDVTGDGHPDLVLLGDPYEGTDTIYVAEADGRGFADPEAWYDADGEGGTIWAGDFDGDGTDGVLYYSPDRTDRLTVLSADDGAFTEDASRPLSGPAINPTIAPVLVGDVDGDGSDELVSPGVTRKAVFVIGVDDGEIGARDRWHHTERTDKDARDQIFNSGVADYALSDVDGDGLDDLVELHSPDDADELALLVLASTGSSFDDAALRGTFGCDAGCDDGFSLVD